jgi:glutamate/tyrosine decarboxylase-like PLP-dependent enzyme
MTASDSSPLDQESLPILQRSLARLAKHFTSLPPGAVDPTDLGRIERVLSEVADRLRDNFPYFHPLYAGQMITPPHPVARLAYALSLWVNPNNHALDGGRASSAMEKEAVANLAGMIGWKAHLGHLTGGGTMANLEALWVAGQLMPGKAIVASSQAHYTHQRLSAVLGLRFITAPCDDHGRLGLEALEEILAREEIGTVVATMGTTGGGAVDPLPGLLELRRRHEFRLHADAAYGGYFLLSSRLDQEARAAFDRLVEVDSIVIDPHKHGLQPYGCGCVLFRDPAVGRLYRHDSPNTYFSSAELHLGEISLECSRPGAAGVALWATQQLLPLVPGGEFAALLDRSRSAALELYSRLAGDERFLVGHRPDLDIVLWTVKAPSASVASRQVRRLFAEAARRDLHLAMAEIPVELLGPRAAEIERDQPTVTALRSVLMKPEHLEWVPEIWQRLSDAADAVV